MLTLYMGLGSMVNGVSGLILASSGAVAHDLMNCFMGIKMTDAYKVRIAKIASVIAGILVGLVASLSLILLSQETFNSVYKLVNVTAPVKLSNPAIISVPLSFISLVLVTLFTQKKKGLPAGEKVPALPEA